MKSMHEDLSKRGYVKPDEFSNQSIEVLQSWLTAKEANKRTIAIRTLANDNKCSTIELLKLLTVESALYTKIEICLILQSGNSQDAKEMIPYLGTIGHNQLHSIGKTSAKKSYPLPRDIIARTLAKMSFTCIDVLLDILSTNDKVKIYEILDAIGWMLFYHPDNIQDHHFKKIKNLYFNNTKDELMVWKICICLSAFQSKESIELLKYIEHDNENIAIKKEVQRSLQLSYQRSSLTKL